jgi:hypothetical protein
MLYSVPAPRLAGTPRSAAKERAPLVDNEVEASRMSKQRSSGACELPKCGVEAGVEADLFCAWQNYIVREKPVVATGVSASKLSVRCGLISHAKRKIVCRSALRPTACPRGTAPLPVLRQVGVNHPRSTEVVRLELSTT